MKEFFGWEGIQDKNEGELIKENLPQEQESRFEIPHSLNGFFKGNDDGTIDIKTENGVLSGLSRDILPDDMKDRSSGELVINFADYNLIAKKMFNELLNSDQNEQE